MAATFSYPRAKPLEELAKIDRVHRSPAVEVKDGAVSAKGAEKRAKVYGVHSARGVGVAEEAEEFVGRCRRTHFGEVVGRRTLGRAVVVAVEAGAAETAGENLEACSSARSRIWRSIRARSMAMG